MSDETPNHVMKQNTFHYVSIIKKLKTLFARKSFGEMFFKYNNTTKHICRDGVYVDYCCGSTAKKCELLTDSSRPAIQIELGADAFEICSPLKTKATIHKVMAVYFRIRNIPLQFRSKLENYHLVALCSNEHLKAEDYSLNDVFKPIVDEIRQLQMNGIQIDENKHIKGTLIHVGGDNLGANEAFGFVKCFSTDYCCRMCMCTKDELQKQTDEQTEMLRNKELHLWHVEEAKKGDYKASKGVIGRCVFDDLDHFNIFDNLTVDIMHDIN